jgi:acyl-ACP thioesterase
MNKFKQDFIIPCYNTDVSWRLKPASFMDLAQEAANCHANILGFGYDDLIASRTAWVLSRMHIEFVDIPLWRDEVVLQTWHKGLNRLFFLRDFLMTDKEGRTRVKATTSWLVMNLDTRRLVRDPNLLDADGVCSDNVIEEPAVKVQMPKGVEVELVMVHKVGYSDVDMNGHANNAMYMHWAMDAVDYEISSSRSISSLTINFNHEIKPLDEVSLYRASVEMEDGLHVFIEGRVAEQAAFIVDIVFSV